MRFRSFARSIVGLVFLLSFLLTAAASPASAKQFPKLGISPKPPLAFGEQIVTLQSPPQTVTLDNKSGSFAIPISNIRVKPPFVKVSTTCGVGIPAGGSCDILIAFKPTVLVRSGSTGD